MHGERIKKVLVTLRILHQQDDIWNTPVLFRRVPGRFPYVEKADIQAVLDSHSAHLTEKNREWLTLLREPEDEEQSDVVVKRCQPCPIPLKNGAWNLDARWRLRYNEVYLGRKTTAKQSKITSIRTKTSIALSAYVVRLPKQLSARNTDIIPVNTNVVSCINQCTLSTLFPHKIITWRSQF